MMHQEAEVMAKALRYWNKVRSPRDFVRDVLPIIRGPESIDWILAQLPHARDRAWVVRELRENYGPHLDLSDESSWVLPGGSYADIEAVLRQHAAFVAHAVRVAVPAIRSWLAAHPDVPGG